MSGRQIVGGRFEIADPERDLLGRGGMGDVYRGRDLHIGEPVAIKALRQEAVSGTPDAIARFIREGEALRELDHHNIVKMVGAVEEGGRHYLVMEYVPGGSLRDLLEQEGHLSVQRTLEIALEVADALTRAHHLGIIHRDLKPSNVLLAEDGTPRLTDFGIAQLASGSRLTGADRAVGTVDYMSPEACNLEAQDRRTDVWSFGVMLYEMLTGERPFVGESPLTTLTAILTRPLPDLERLHPDVPDALIDLVYRMLEKDPAARIPSVRMVGTELETILEGTRSTTTGAPQAMSAYRPSPPTSRFATPTPSTERLRHNLPVQVTPFVGRDAELSELSKLLTDPNVHLLTILGPGGMGKTRLGLQAAGMLVEQVPHDGFAHGVFFVSLAPLRSTDAIVPAVASALGFSFHQGGKPRQQLLDYLREKQMLILLDNYEHLLEGVDIVADILRTAPKVKVLATSRARLSVQGEHRFHVAGMDFPDWETPEDALEPTSLTLRDAARYSAVKLFLQSARRAEPAFELRAEELRYVARICRLVGGMPLGILLAAAWVEMLTPEEIAAEIERGLDFLEDSSRDLPERQRSVRAVFDHSWNLLAERERAVLAGLSVFRGGFTRDAAQRVTDASLRELRSLVDRSLLRRAPTGRYEVHELLRQYAAEKLDRSPAGGEAIRDRHAATYAAALQGWAADLGGRQQIVAIEEIREDIDNARAAWDWAIERERVEWLDHALEGLCLFYRWGSHNEEGEAACRKAGGRLGESAPHLPAGARANRLRVLAHALAWQGLFSNELGRSEAVDRCYERALAALDRAERSDPACDTRRERALILQGMSVRARHTDLGRARQLAERSLELYQALGDRWGMAQALQSLGAVLWNQGTLEEANRLREDSLSLRRALGDRRGMIWPLQSLTYGLNQLGQPEEAERVAQEAFAIAQQVGNPIMIAWTNYTLCTALCNGGRFEEARSPIEGILASFRELGSRGGEAWGLWELGLSAKHLGSYEKARAATEAALTLFREIGDRAYAANCSVELGCLALAEGAYGAAQEWLQQSIAIYRRIGGMRLRGSKALALLAYAARGLGQPAQARLHLGAALRMAAEIHAHLTVLHSLPAVALLLMDGGAVERAVELYALATRYSFVANSCWFEDVAGKHAAAAAATMPPEVVTAAQERGRARDLRATVEELLAELEE